ncbi:MAG: addiction module toxin, HicA family [Chloroflexi bacterium]|nr:type II toxin-antitoxin system HicA family toxin [Ardenticatenaceae bacterium]MBL1128301.1 addiction module toxin, HicA family [Chloroflexota bacterium]NOG34374.1 addiction module toxin, HicA family [Chloroflexota bacterium]
MTGQKLITALRRAGFQVIRVRGGHHFLEHPDGRHTVVPVHRGEIIANGTNSAGW